MTARSAMPLVPLLAIASAAAAQPSPAPGADFPEGPGKAYVVRTCGGCHDLNRLKAGYTPEGWHTVLRMMHNTGVEIPPAEREAVTAYLVRSFPERARPAAAVIEGPVRADIRLFKVPTTGSRPHDPMAARDGSIWYTGQLANALGRVDPATGEVREYVLPHAYSGPHGLVEDRDGNVWFTGNNAGYIGKLDPRSGMVTEFALPDRDAKDPHTLVFDRRGILWFTVQQANKVGRLDPVTGNVRLVNVPTPRARPYGMAVNSRGQVFFVEFGANKVGTIDDAMVIKEYVLPNPAARPRRIAIGPDDLVWYTDFARGYLGRLDPATGKTAEWPTPSGRQAEPYGIVHAQGALWYSESFAKPNTIVRFDPRTESFQTWAIPGGGDIVRNMDVTRAGNPVLAHSLVDRVGLVVIGQ